jgi:hypothetical protein
MPAFQFHHVMSVGYILIEIFYSFSVGKDSGIVFGSKFDVTLALSCLVSKYSLTNECTKDIIQIAHLIKQFPSCPIPNSLTSIMNGMEVKDVPVKYHHLCRKCGSMNSHDLFDNPLGNIMCCETKPTGLDEHFIIFDIRKLLEITLPLFKIQFHGSRRCPLSYCSYVNQLRVHQGFEENDLTLTLNTDGAPLFKSSSVSLWPVLGLVNEADIKSRDANVLILGLWIGRKPRFDSFLKPIIDEMLNLRRNPVIWFNQGTRIESKVFVLCIMCDSIARPAVQNMHQFNGAFGCSYCYFRNKNHLYPYEKELERRDKLSYITDLFNVEDNDPSFLKSRGVKGPSPFEDLGIYFDVIDGNIHVDLLKMILFLLPNFFLIRVCLQVSLLTSCMQRS